jgi:hypothetical protein
MFFFIPHDPSQIIQGYLTKHDIATDFWKELVEDMDATQNED